MDKGIINILKKHGCLYMADDYKELIEEIETYVKDREKQCAINDVSQQRKLVCDHNLLPKQPSDATDYCVCTKCGQYIKQTCG